MICTISAIAARSANASSRSAVRASSSRLNFSMIRLGSTCASSGIGWAYLAPSPATIRPCPLSYQQECSANLPIFGSVLRERLLGSGQKGRPVFDALVDAAEQTLG